MPCIDERVSNVFKAIDAVCLVLLKTFGSTIIPMFIYAGLSCLISLDTAKIKYTFKGGEVQERLLYLCMAHFTNLC